MQHLIRPRVVMQSPATFNRFIQPLRTALTHIPPLESRGNHPLTLDFEHQTKTAVYYHMEQFDSGCHLIHTLGENLFARTMIAPPGGMAKSTFFEVIKTRGLPQLMEVYTHLCVHASAVLPKAFPGLGDLVAVDPTFIPCSLSVEWADYQEGCKKAQAHFGYDPHRSLPGHFVLTDGKADAGDYVEALVNPGQTGIMDRYFQCYRDFDRWHSQGRGYVCRIKDNAQKTVLKKNPVTPGGKILSDEWVILGDSSNCTLTPVRLVVFRAGRKIYWIATNRFDLTAEQIAEIYRLRWAIEVFFGWWKRHMRVYHLIARTHYGLMFQLLSGLITYLLLAIYCHEHHGEKVSIRRLRELRHAIQNEAMFLILFPLILHPLLLYKFANS